MSKAISYRRGALYWLFTGLAPPRPGLRSPRLDQIPLGEQRDGGQGAARPLHRVLDGEDLQLPDRLAPDLEGLLEHGADGALGLVAGGDVVELHDDPRLGRGVP